MQLLAARPEIGKGLGKEERVWKGRGREGKEGIHVAVAKATEDMPRTVAGRKCPSYAMQYCLPHQSAHRRHVAIHNGGPQVPLFAILFATSYLCIVAVA